MRPARWARLGAKYAPATVAQGAVMSIYEIHPNSMQRIRVVSGAATWHVRRETTAGWALPMSGEVICAPPCIFPW
jgi:hypothetical protein